LNTVGESVLFDEGGGGSTDGVGKRQDSELQLAKRLPNLARLQLRSGDLKKLHEGDDAQGAIWCGVDRAGCPLVAAQRPEEDLGIEDHFDFRERRCFSMPV
jgi:hypothetical protein